MKKFYKKEKKKEELFTRKVEKVKEIDEFELEEPLIAHWILIRFSLKGMDLTVLVM